MLTAYIEAAMRRMRCEWLPNDGIFYCEIPELPGVWASGEYEDAARSELREVLEDWIALGLAMRHPIPSWTASTSASRWSPDAEDRSDQSGSADR
jgi:predicted RNase H-like HicB family nuclease